MEGIAYFSVFTDSPYFGWAYYRIIIARNLSYVNKQVNTLEGIIQSLGTNQTRLNAVLSKVAAGMVTKNYSVVCVAKYVDGLGLFFSEIFMRTNKYRCLFLYQCRHFIAKTDTADNPLLRELFNREITTVTCGYVDMHRASALMPGGKQSLVDFNIDKPVVTFISYHRYVDGASGYILLNPGLSVGL